MKSSSSTSHRPSRSTSPPRRQRIGKAEIEMRPQTDIGGLLAKQPGFKVDPEGAMHVRGGRSSEMLVKVDGVDLRDPLVAGGRNSVNMSALNVEEIEVLTGGDARYGGFQSALVNVSTPEGSPAQYAGTLEWRTDRAFKTYSFNTDRYDYRFPAPCPSPTNCSGRRSCPSSPRARRGSPIPTRPITSTATRATTLAWASTSPSARATTSRPSGS